MRRVLLVLAGLVVLFLVGRAVVRALVSDETRIRWIVEDMQEGFDETRMDPVLVAFAEDFHDDTSGARRQDVREALAYLFLTAKHPETKAFPYRVEVEIARLEVGRDQADSDLVARFLDSREAEPLAWEIAIAAHWVRGEYGWRIQRTSHETKSGRMPR